MAENTVEEKENTVKNKGSKANPNPSNSLLVEQFLDNFKTNKLGACLKQLDDGEIILLERSNLDEFKILLESKEEMLSDIIAKYNSQNEKLIRVNDARIRFKNELTAVFTSFKQIIKLGSSIKPFNNLIERITKDAKKRNINPKNRISFGLFFAEKAPEILDVLLDSDLHEKIMNAAKKIDMKTPLEIMVQRGVLPPEYAQFNFVDEVKGIAASNEEKIVKELPPSTEENIIENKNN